MKNGIVKEKIKKIAIGVTNFCVIDDVVWFITAYYNYLFCMDLKTWEIKMAYRLPFGRPYGKGEALFLYLYGEVLYVIPSCSDYPIVKVNPHNLSMESVNNEMPTEKWGIGVAQDSENLYVPVLDKSCYLKIEKETLHSKMVGIHHDIKGAEVIKKSNEGFWLLESESGDLLRLDDGNSVNERYNRRPKNCMFYEGGPIYCSIIGDDNPILLPRYSNMILRLNEAGELVSVGEPFDDYKFKYSLFLAGQVVGDHIITYVNGGNLWRTYDEQFNILKEHEVCVGDEVLETISSDSPMYKYGEKCISDLCVSEDGCLFDVGTYISEINANF